MELIKDGPLQFLSCL